MEMAVAVVGANEMTMKVLQNFTRNLYLPPPPPPNRTQFQTGAKKKLPDRKISYGQLPKCKFMRYTYRGKRRK